MLCLYFKYASTILSIKKEKDKEKHLIPKIMQMVNKLWYINGSVGHISIVLFQENCKYKPNTI